MKTRNTILTAVAAAGVLGTGYALGTGSGSTIAATTAAPAPTTATPTPATQPSTSTEATTAETTQETTQETTAAGATGTFTGTAATHRYGSVTVTVTLTDGVITDATASYEASGDKSVEHSEQAIPTLNSQVVASNGEVSTVSGSTYTSEAYATSLQSALDQA